MNGIDVSAAQQVGDWARLRAAGIGFAMICASRGRGGRAEADGRFAEYITAAARAGIAPGVYHTLGAADLNAALAEADQFCAHLAPHREKLALWACCAAEDGALPREPGRAADVLIGFLRKVQAAGFSPMLQAAPPLLARLERRMPFPLWLSYWGAPEARALGYAPTIWQYGTGSLDGCRGRPGQNAGYFRLPPDKFTPKFGNQEEKSCRKRQTDSGQS